jgi:starvation-inducible DNA-binding protein
MKKDEHIKIGIPSKELNHVVTLLEKGLANEMVLYVKTRKAHWNVAGDSFMELHKLYEAHYKQMEETIDEMAERIGKLGHKAIGTMHEFLKLAHIKEHVAKYHSTKDTLKELLGDHESIIVECRKDISACADKYKDAGTADFLTGVLQQHETMAWIIRRYLD